ncbi:MAG: hypothetical protein HeimC3_35990 [Candidatus Heimdallarchaeota archaeon LC_3]|nr:MAG: hypothetical protein HeimC3_35990 [Candidatus Heimdallarchaeota archaeon LC_3]
MYENKVDDQISDYSFTESFKNSRLAKKFIIMIFLPFIPIYSISKYFQMRGRRKGKNPKIILYMIFLFLLYLISVYPLGISLLWIINQVYLFPISFLIAYYFHKYYFKQQEVRERVLQEEMGDPFLFEVKGFAIKSKSFFFVLILSLLFSVLGLLFIFCFIALIFILIPKIYKKLSFLPKFLLILSYPIFGFLSYLPGVNMKGKWFIEQGSERKRLETIPEVIKFIFVNWQPFFLVNIGVVTLSVRAILWIQGDPPIGSLLSTEVLTGSGFFFMFAIVPVFMALYFIVVWVWEDAELKVAYIKTSTKGLDESSKGIEETTQLIPASDSIRSIFTLAFGLPAVFWFVDESGRRSVDFATGTIGVIAIILIFFIFIGGVVILMGVMYYRSGAHEHLVNELRNHIRARYEKKEDENVQICYSSVRPITLENI